MSGHINLLVIRFQSRLLMLTALSISDEPLCKFYQNHYWDTTKPDGEESKSDPSLSVSRFDPEGNSVTVGGVNVSFMRFVSCVQINSALCAYIPVTRRTLRIPGEFCVVYDQFPLLRL